MTLNHLIVGTDQIEASLKFYCDFLGFKKTDDDPGAAGGAVLEHDNSELLLIPFKKEKLPNPAHFALEVKTDDVFVRLLSEAEKLGLAPRSMPARNSAAGATRFKRGSHSYKIFYVYDPSGVNVEVMMKIGSDQCRSGSGVR